MEAGSCCARLRWLYANQEPTMRCVCVSVEKPSEVMAMAAESGYSCVVHAGQLTLALSFVFPYNLSPSPLLHTHTLKNTHI